jgi:hypothetical protein
MQAHHLCVVLSASKQKMDKTFVIADRLKHSKAAAANENAAVIFAASAISERSTMTRIRATQVLEVEVQ